MNARMLPYVSIHYGDVYHFVEVRLPDETVRKFETGDAPKDWRDSHEWMRSLGYKQCMYSSLCDHFVCDVPGYRFNEDSAIERCDDPTCEQVHP